MPFAPDISVCSSEDCKFLGFTDNSGIYNVTTNTTGYRTTNLPEITRVQTVAQGGGAGQVTGADFFTLATPQTNYYIWFDLDNGSVDPAPAGRTGIEVNIAAGNTAATVASNINAAINAFTFATPGFTSAVNSDLVTISNVQTGNVTNAADGAGVNATNFTFTIVQNGVWNDVAVADATGAFIEFELPGVSYPHKTITADTVGVVDIATNRITITSHGYSTRDQVILVSANNPATLPGGLSQNRIYFIIRVDANIISLATTAINATAGTAIDITTTGSGVVTVQRNVISVFSTLPNITDTQFSASSSDLSYTTSTHFPDGLYTIRYVVYGNGGGTAFTNIVIREFLIYCKNKCCVYNMIAAISEANCNCNDEVVERGLFAYTMLQALKYAAQSGQETRASNINKTIENLCNQDNCTSCS